MSVIKKLFSQKTNKYVSGATLLGVAVLLFVSPLHANAGTITAGYPLHDYIVTSDCQLKVNFTQNISQPMASQSAQSRSYRGVYNVWTTDYGGIGVYSAISFYTFIKNNGWSSHIIASTTNSITIDYASYVQSKSLTSGDFFHWLRLDGVDTYIQIHVNSLTSCTPYASAVDINSTGFNSITNTRFLSLDITGTSTVNFDVDYYLDPNEVNVNVSQLNPTYVRYKYSLNPTLVFDSEYDPINPLVTGTSSSLGQLTGLSDGLYDLSISFSNFGCNAELSACPFPDSYVYSSFTITGGVLSATGTLEFYDSQSFLDEGSYARPCGITDIGGCLINALSFLFVPSSESLQTFSDLNDSLENKFPFAYAYDFSNQIDNLYSGALTATTTIAFDFNGYGDLTLLSADLLSDVPFSSLIKSILGYLLWLMFAVQMYRRTLTVFNHSSV